MNYIRSFAVLTGALSCLGAATVPAAVLEVTCNSTSASDPVSNRDLNGQLANLLSAGGQGVSGLPGDRALDLRSAKRMGRGDNSIKAGPSAQIDIRSTIGGSFTAQCWFRTNPGEVLADFARLFDTHDSSRKPQTGFELWAGRMDTANGNKPVDPGTLTLWVNDRWVTTSTPAYAATGSWVFVAVSYDGTASTGNVRFYQGTPGSAVRLVETMTLAQGPMHAPTVPLTIGNRDRSSVGVNEYLDRPFRGLLDNLRLFNGVLPIESLEQLRVNDAPPKAADPIRVNFQPINTPIVAGWLADTGAVYGLRSGGLSYGWNQTIPRMRDRDSVRSPDQRHDTLAHTQAGLTKPAVWEVKVPNGLYDVQVLCGDPDYYDGVFIFTAEGTLVVNGRPSAVAPWVEGGATVQVADGRLTLANASGSLNNKVNSIEITLVPSASN